MILTRDILWHIVTILKAELQLDDSRVYIFNQKYQLPTDNGLLIAVGIETGKPFGAQSFLNPDGTETQTLNMSAMLWLDIVSRDTSALDRKEEIVMALNSQFAQSVQEKYSFHIGRLPPVPIPALSEVEGSAIPYRFKIMMQVQYLVKKTKTTPYYSTSSDSITIEE